MTPPEPTTARGPAQPARPRVAPGRFSGLLLLALTVQLSLAMLEWAGPGSADTRQRLATTIVAAAHRGVFTEQDRPDRPRALRPAPLDTTSLTARPHVAAGPSALARLIPGWRTTLPPPAC